MQRGEYVETSVNRILLNVVKFMDERYYKHFQQVPGAGSGDQAQSPGETPGRFQYRSLPRRRILRQHPEDLLHRGELPGDIPVCPDQSFLLLSGPGDRSHDPKNSRTHRGSHCHHHLRWHQRPDERCYCSLHSEGPIPKKEGDSLSHPLSTNPKTFQANSSTFIA